MSASRPTGRVELRENALFRALPPERLADLDVDLETVAFAPNEVIFEEGAEGDFCYLVESGLVRISKDIAGGGQETVGFIGPGEFFGELALFYSAPRSARATAQTSTRVGKLGREQFDRLRALAPLEMSAAIGNAGIQHLRDLHARFVQHLGDADRFRDLGIGVGLVAHDVRDPLGTIMMAAQMLRDATAEEPIAAARLLPWIDLIERTVGAIVESLEDLLADVRGDAPPPRTRFALGELVREVERLVAGQLRKREGAKLRTVADSTATLWGERRQLVRALANLVRNAVESLPAEGGQVELRATAEDHAVVFAVSDTGCGIPLELQGQIFERRFTHGKAGGTGLGLSQVQRVVERHGGRIDVESRVDEGTTFRIRIPTRDE